MDKEKLWSCIDHTLLKPTAGWEAIRTLCDEAERYHAASVCIPPVFVEKVKKVYGNRIRICTVIGFPLGYNTTAIKVAELREAIDKGADELDMVINLGLAVSGDFRGVSAEIKALRDASPGKILKVIIETCYLSKEQKIDLCACVGEAGADYIKTSTGFGPAGASLEDVELFVKHIRPGIKIKAAGGISTLEDLEAYIKAGCSRIGTSRGVNILGGV
ncbi:MAG: deoxyribose-phosphate aldolase [Treponema sp.]|jgi:deoxyribose-phosphate aldolase|nr:deoxyribose-phosphate aldolase [Treponema sp.]